MQSMMIAEGRTANALGGKTARACDSCLKKRARWFCVADDAFLCQACDTSVHSANQLASRHERVRLETSSNLKSDEKSSVPVWHQGFTRKARTPRHNKPTVQPPKKDHGNVNSLPLVPEIGAEENNSHDENEEQLLYRVPVFEPFGAELCDDSNEGADISKELKYFLDDNDDGCGMDNYNIPAELVEFAADVENLLGTALEDDSSCGLGEMECKEYDINGAGVSNLLGDKRVKIEDEDDEEVQAVIASHFDPALDSTRESFSWDFDDYSSSPMLGEEEEMKMAIGTPTNNYENKAVGKMRISLKLNYEEVITAWDSQGCPWTNGTRPDSNPDDCWPDFLGNGWGTFQHLYGATGGRSGGRDEDREARVSRYREKRRTRLFSKKIRYEVRKLNAEKRPRMKGRFVKRTAAFTGGSSSFPNYLLNKS